MSHDYATSKKIATKTITILAIITVGEVLFALTGKGYIIEGLHFPHVLISLVMMSMSVVKAYLIVYEFMHMKYEMPGLVRSVLLPLVLLVWAIIAFLYEGRYWERSRAEIQQKNKLSIESPAVGLIYELKSDDFQ